MNNQEYSIKHLQLIFDQENRKGKNIEFKFKSIFDKSLQLLESLKERKLELKSCEDSDKKEKIKNEIQDIKEKRKNEITTCLIKLSSKIAKYSFQIKQGKKIKGNYTYRLDDSAEAYFISKIIQSNIKKAYKISLLGRHQIISCVRNILEDEFPKIVVRTDIESFYESIPHQGLFLLIENDNKLSLRTKKYIINVIEQFATLANCDKGIPRGIGFSAYLAEIYLISIDNEIKSLPDIIYYARYVDDIIVVFSPERMSLELSYYQDLIVKKIADKNLNINANKTHTYNLFENTNELQLVRCENLNEVNHQNIVYDNALTFLGYRFGYITVENNKNANCLVIDLSEDKEGKYKKRINDIFEAFKISRSYNRKKQFKLLESRVKYLSANSKLSTNKGNVFIGVYYSNPYLNNHFALTRIQEEFMIAINKCPLLPTEKAQLELLDFTQGYSQRIFYTFPIKTKYYNRHNCTLKANKQANKKNRGILQWGLNDITYIWHEEK